MKPITTVILLGLVGAGAFIGYKSYTGKKNLDAKALLGVLDGEPSGQDAVEKTEKPKISGRKIKDQMLEYKNELDKTAKDAETVKNTDPGVMKIQKADWEKMIAEKASLQEMLRNNDVDKEDKIAKARAESKIECLKEQEIIIEKERQASVGEAVRMAKEMGEKLAIYSYPSAIVNGNCLAKMQGGETRHLHVVNGCVNVVKKEVGNDGQIDGLSKSTSVKASKKGVMNIQCYTGDANIKMLKERCDVKVNVKPELYKIGEQIKNN